MAASLEDLVSLAMFARVVEAKSFTAAASALSVSKSVVSKRVAQLEQRLGTRLLLRTTRRLSLTSEGARLYERCLHMLQVVDEAPELASERRDEPRGVLRLNSPVIFADRYLAEIALRFVRRYPQVQVELVADNAMIDLVSERVDVAIRLSPGLRSSSLIARRVSSAPKVVCAAPSYLQGRTLPRTPDDLRSHDCLRYLRVSADVEWRFKSGREHEVVPVSGPLASDSAEALRRAALAGAGVVVLPRFMLADDLAAGRLLPLLGDHPVEPLGVYAVYAKGKVVPAKVRKFVEHLASTLEREL